MAGMFILRGCFSLPSNYARSLLQQIHQSTHLGERKNEDLIRKSHLKIFGLRPKLNQVINECKACKLVNTKHGSMQTGTRMRGSKPGINWEIDFTEIKPGMYGYKYLLVFIDTFSGWTEAYPTKHKTANIAIKKLLEEIIPRYGLPLLCYDLTMDLPSPLR